MKLALITLVCFVVSNIASTLMVQSEARNRPYLGGLFESIYALFWIYAAKYALNTSPLEIGALIIGNFWGAVFGVKIGERFVHDEADAIVDDRLEEAEAALLMAEQTLHELNQEIALHHEHDEDAH